MTDWIMVGTTSAYVIIALFTLFSIKRQAELAEKALIETRNANATAAVNACAAKRSADTAQKALHANRPSIVVTYIDTQVETHGRTGRPNVLVGYTPQIYNLGNANADIVGIFSHSQVFDAFTEAPAGPPFNAEEPYAADLIWDAPYDRQEFPRGILHPQECIANYVAGFFPVNWVIADIEAVAFGEKRRAVFGLIKYRSTVAEYYTRFFYWWNPDSRGFRRAERPELNERT